jgi:hypothetical protein
MAVTGMTITGVGAMRAEFRRRGASARSYRATVIYDAKYAIFVHENLSITHPNGRAKFLEEVIRTRQREAGRIIEKIMRRKNGTLKEAVLETAKFFLEESKKLVPVRTGNLRDSGRATVSS